MANEPDPTFNQVNLVVRDMDAAVDFYRRLGVKIDDVDATWDPHHRTIATGEGLDFELDSNTFASVWNQGWPRGRAGAVIGFRVGDREDVDRICEDLTDAGYVGQQPPYDAGWGSRYAIVDDPDGNSVGLMSPMDPARRTKPPPPPG